MTKNHYTDEFKQQIVSLYQSGKTTNEIANDYQIGKSTIWKLVHEFIFKLLIYRPDSHWTIVLLFYLFYKD
ncbi:MAG: transposase [Spiroplasma poulsonii]|uniref:Transposase n=1 Tax=Spiroplasma poulsonii TaxID=2138 RepID=A0A2R6Y5M9_9MOLU|nr:Transposase [Spiroplasma poulsonii]MBW1242536.1 transposase [Spiroplasma poulsonii]PTQ58114.1 Transposase [Spiroplasma poulsonii]